MWHTRMAQMWTSATHEIPWSAYVLVRRLPLRRGGRGRPPRTKFMHIVTNSKHKQFSSVVLRGV